MALLNSLFFSSLASVRIELPASLAKRFTLSKAKDRYWNDFVYQSLTAFAIKKNVIAHRKAKRGIILRGVMIGYALEPRFIDYSYRITLNDQVKSIRESVTSGRENTMRVLEEVLGFALVLARAEIQSIIKPDGHQRGDMGSSIWAHCR
jgi:hypothetical protein